MVAETLSGNAFALKVGPITEVEMSETTLVTRSVSASTIGRVGTIDVRICTTSDALFCALVLLVLDAVFVSDVD